MGLFAVVCLVLMGLLLLAFSKSASLFAPTYEIKMVVSNVSGLKERSAVLLAGVPVGMLKSYELAPGGSNVVLRLKIYQKYPIQAAATFAVEQVGVLGDQFVAITTSTNGGPMLKNGDTVYGRDAFNLQEAALAAGDLIGRARELARELNNMVSDIKTNPMLKAQITNLAATITNFRQLSEEALSVVGSVKGVVQSNSPPIARALVNVECFSSNMVSLSTNLQAVTEKLHQTIAANRAGLGETMTNFQAASASIKSLTADLDAGRGLAGSLLKDAAMQSQMSQTFSNLSVLSSNLNRYGLLYKPRPARSAPTHNSYPGKSPF